VTNHLRDIPGVSIPGANNSSAAFVEQYMSGTLVRTCVSYTRRDHVLTDFAQIVIP
jgi:hypothetical protein